MTTGNERLRHTRFQRQRDRPQPFHSESGIDNRTSPGDAKSGGLRRLGDRCGQPFEGDRVAHRGLPCRQSPLVCRSPSSNQTAKEIRRDCILREMRVIGSQTRESQFHKPERRSWNSACPHPSDFNLATRCASGRELPVSLICASIWSSTLSIVGLSIRIDGLT